MGTNYGKMYDNLIKLTTLDSRPHQVAEMVADAEEDTNAAIAKAVEEECHDLLSVQDAVAEEKLREDIPFKINKELSTMYSDFETLKSINEELPTKSLGDDEIKDLDFLLREINNKPKLSLLGISGAGKSTLINKVIGSNVLDASSGKGAVTQYPVELIYRDNTDFFITKNDDIQEHELRSILKDKLFISEFHNELLDNDITDDLKKSIYDFIDQMNQWEIPYNDNKKKYIWKDFNKRINGNENKKYHFHYQKKINDKNINLWINVSPFIKKLSIYLNSELLDHVTLVDLPGLYDDSEVRTRKTTEYLENETDFIMIVENNDRAISTPFIEKQLNGFMVNIIVKKQIPDILVTLTNIDRTYESSKKEIVDDSDEEDDLDEETFNEINSEFEKRLKNTQNKIKEKIQNNESLTVHNISPNDIKIRFYSSKRLENNNKHTVEGVKNTIKEVCLKRIDRYSNIIHELMKDHYNNIKTYINKESIQEEVRNKIKKILSEIRYEIQKKVDLKVNWGTHPLITSCDFTRILTKNDEYKYRLTSSEETHGNTLIAVLRKKIHRTCFDETYNLIDELSQEYITVWTQHYSNFIKKMDDLVDKNKNNIQIMDVFNNLKDINNIDNDEITRLKGRIKGLLIKSNNEIRIDGEYRSPEHYLKTEGLKLIQWNIEKNIHKYHLRSIDISGNGSSNTCREYVNKMLSISKNTIVKDNINKGLNYIFEQINREIKLSFDKKLDKIFSQYYSSYKNEGININIEEINQKLDTMSYL